MDGFYDQQVPFMVPGVSLCGFWFVLFSLFKFYSYWFSDYPLWAPLLHSNLHCLMASFRNLEQRNVEGGLWLTERGSFWTRIWLMILKVVKLSPLLWLPHMAPSESSTQTLPLFPSRGILMLLSSVFNSRVVSGSQSTSRGLVSWRQVSWLSYFPYKTFYGAF